jgi:hypothetical protein
MIILSLLTSILYSYSNAFTKPLCKNCIYYKPSWFDGYNFGECKKFSKHDNKTDILIYNYTHLCRDNENECGKNGTYFQRKIMFTNL